MNRQARGITSTGKLLGTLLVAAAALALPTPAAAEAPSARVDTRKSYLDFAIRIPPVLRLTTLWARDTVEVPEGARVVDVDDAASFEVLSNTRSGYELRFHIVDPDVEAVRVEGLHRPVTVTRGGTSVRFQPRSAADMKVQRALSYEIVLSKNARPGPRRMPVFYSVHAGA